MAYAENPRDYFAARIPFTLDVPGWFKHTPAVNAPVPPAFPNGYDAPSQAEIKAWLPNKDDSTLTQPGSIAYAALFRTYMAANEAWISTNNLSRIAQYRLALADAHISNYHTVPVGLSPTATPVSAPPTTTVRQQTTPGGITGGGGGIMGFTDTYDTGSANEIVPTGSSQLIINIWGGGGGGGGGGGNPYGGASGGYSTRTIAIVSADYGISIPYVVGTKGIGGVTNGGNAGNTTVGAFTVNAGTFTLTANGGTGSTGSTNGGTGGTASGGTTNTSGSSGTNGANGAGGNAPGTGGGTGGTYASPGNSPGAGGGPGLSINADKGGNGAPGRVQFIWS